MGLLVQGLLLTFPLVYVAGDLVARRRCVRRMREPSAEEGMLFLSATWNGLPGGEVFNRVVFFLGAVPLSLGLAFACYTLVTEPELDFLCPMMMLVLFAHLLTVNTYGPQRFLIGRGTFVQAGATARLKILEYTVRPPRGVTFRLVSRDNAEASPVQRVTLEDLSPSQIQDIESTLGTGP